MVLGCLEPCLTSIAPPIWIQNITISSIAASSTPSPHECYSLHRQHNFHTPQQLKEPAGILHSLGRSREMAFGIALNLWYFWLFWDCLEKYAHIQFRRGSGIFECFVFLGTVSRNMLISGFGKVPESLGLLVLLGLSQEICSFRGLWVLVFLFSGDSRGNWCFVFLN